MNFHYRCSECNFECLIAPSVMLCPQCHKKQDENEPLRGVLEVVLKGDYQGPSGNDFDVLSILPVEKKYFPEIPVGNTPLWKPSSLRKEYNFPELYIKDDSLNPTGSLKDRASFLVAAFAKKFKIDRIVVASTGNAGSSMAGVGAATGIAVTIFLPKNAPQAKMVQAIQYGAKVISVDGNYDAAYDLSMEYVKRVGGLNRNTAYNPMTIEGKKSVALEIYKDLGEAPDCIFVSVGDGVILSGIYKGFRDLLSLKLIKKIPKIYAVQAEGSSAIHKAFQTGAFKRIATQTIADSICVDVPRCGYLAIKNLKEHNGKTLVVSDDQIIQAQHQLALKTGHFAEPAGATAFAGFLKEKGKISSDSKIVILTTGSGLKDINSALKGIKFPKKVIKTIDEIE